LKENIEKLIEQNDNIDENLRQQIAANKTLIKEKEFDRKEIQEEIYDNLGDDDYNKELDAATDFEIQIRTLEEKIKRVLDNEKHEQPRHEENKEKSTVRLPKLEIIKFGGEPTE